MSTQFTNRQWRLPNNENKDKQSNYSMDFDGSSQYIDCGESVLHTSNATVFTLSAWIKPKTGMSLGIIAADAPAASPTNGGFWIGYDNRNTATRPANGISYNIKTSTGYQSGKSNDNVITLNVWNHIVLVLDGQATLYVNGVSSTNRLSDNIGDLVTQSHELLLGTEDTLSFEFNGQIDGVSIYNYALSSSQITTLYGSSSTGIGNPMSLSPKPVAYYPLGDQDAFNGSNYLVPNSSLKDYVFDFDGSTSYITTSVNPSNYSALTASAWINFDSTTGRQSVFSQYQDNTNNVSSMWMLWNVVSNELWFFIIDSSNVFKTAKWTSSNSFTLTTGNWYNVVGIWDGSYVKVYVNGEAGSYSDAATSLNSSSLDFLIGSGMTSGGGIPYDEFNGKISNVQVFNTALPATGSNSVETLYNNGSPLTSMSGFTSLQAWYKLDASATYDGSNWTIPDDSTNSNDGTSSGMTQANLVQSDLSFTSGYSPYALDFDAASGDEINTNYTPPTGASARTISIWFNPDTSGNADICGYGTSSVAGLFDIVLHGGNVYVHGYGAYQDYCKGAYTVGAWNHYVITYDGTTAKGYVNNVATPENTVTLSTGTTNTFKIGNGYYNLGNFTGKLSNCSIWNAALTSAQVSELYNEGVPSNLNNHSAYSNLVSWWQLGSNSSFNTNWTVLDEKGSNNGTSVNMTEDAIVDGVGSYANGVSSGMSDNIVGDAFGSSANSLSYNMDVLDRTEDTPS